MVRMKRIAGGIEGGKNDGPWTHGISAAHGFPTSRNGLSSGLGTVRWFWNRVIQEVELIQLNLQAVTEYRGSRVLVLRGSVPVGHRRGVLRWRGRGRSEVQYEILGCDGLRF